jgi:alcohol dehydrogenase class IV
VFTVKQFEYYNPVRLIFGRAALARLGEIAVFYGRKALLVTGKTSARKTGLLDRAAGYLKESGITIVVFDRVESNPLTTTVEQGAALAVAEGCEFVIGLGGGSALDTAKGIAFAAVNPGDFSAYIFGKPGVGALPIIAVTTTAGTGSEGDSLAVFTNPVTNDKKSLKSPFIYPKAAIVDPELLTTLPPPIIAATGIDVFCHALEGFVARRGNPMSDLMALQAIELISRNLPRVYDDPADLEAWDRVALANTLGGMVIDAAGVALPHGLEHPVSGLLNVTHGEGLAALLVEFLVYSYDEARAKLEAVSQAMGAALPGKSGGNGTANCIDKVQRFLERLNLTKRLRDLGVTWEQVEWLAENSLRTMTYALSNSPKVPQMAEIKNLYLKCL